jgi:hypothetical protein
LTQGSRSSPAGSIRQPWAEGLNPFGIPGRETLEEKLKPYLQTGEWSE